MYLYHTNASFVVTTCQSLGQYVDSVTLELPYKLGYAVYAINMYFLASDSELQLYKPN